MKKKGLNRVIALVLCFMLCITAVPMSALASIPNWSDNNVVYDGTSFGTDGYYNVISKKDYVLVPGAAVESEMVLNNADGTRRQVLHIIEVDPSNPDVSIVPGYYQIDKDLSQEANWSHKELTEMAKYYENNLGYNIVGGMNTDLYYNSYSPRVLVYNGESIGNFDKNVATGGTVLNPTSSILYVFKDAEGNISCDVKAFNRDDLKKYLEDGTLLHAVGVSFGMVVKDGKLVNTTEKRGNDDAARSMVGVKEDGTLVICMNDGRGANNSVGFSSYEEGEAMLALGCKWAANCDGGGSSTFLTKRVGEETFTMRSVPCDGAQRPTAHGIFVASNVAPTGILDVVNIESNYDYFAPNVEFEFGAEAIDTHGYAMDMPTDATWKLSDESFGTIDGGKFVSNGTKGTVEVQILSGGKVVGTKSINIADPEVFKLSATSTVMPYSTTEKVKTITLPIVAMIGEANVYYDRNAVNVTLSNENAGVLDGFKFTSTTDTNIAGVDVTITYGETALVYAIEFGKGSEVIYDFENGNVAGFMGLEDAIAWSKENGVNNTLVGTDPLAGQCNEYLSSETFVATNENGGQVRNGNNALAWRLDNTDAAFASWSYNVLFNTGDTIVLRDVANDMKATTLGMWVYIPEGAAGLAFQSQLYTKNTDGTYSCKQDHFMFTSAASGKQTNLNSATEADIPESRWVYATIDISKYDYLCTPVAKDEGNSRSPSFLRTYVKPTAPAELTFYIDDITLDYSSAVDDRILPTITNTTYSTSDTAVDLANGTVVNGNNVAFSATVADNTVLDNSTGKIYVDGVEIAASVAGKTLSSNGDVYLVPGTHTVTFEIKDELGNPAKVNRTFTVDGEAPITIAGHNDSGEAAKAQSVYYVDINTTDITKVNKVVTNLKLNNANKWETEGAVVANGFKATYSYNEVSELLTVTVEVEDASKIDATAETLVSIPVRVWTYDRFNYVTNAYIPVAEMGNKPVVNVVCDVVYGEVSFADKTTSPLGGKIDVATELTTISSPYHEHDAELTVLNQEPTSTEYGYENRTYCETCKSVVDWGTILEPNGHNYAIVGDRFECIDEGCDEVYVSGTGIFEMNGDLYYSINNVLKKGWQTADDGYCYAGSDYKLYTGEKAINSVTYKFGEDGILTEGAWVTNSMGTRYSYGPKFYTRMWVEIDGKTYYFGRDSYMYTGVRYVKDNPDTPPYWYDFGETGGIDKTVKWDYEGLYSIDDNLYYIKDGTSQKGLHLINGNYYYFTADQYIGIKNKSYYVKNTNGLTLANGKAIKANTYDFDAEGKMILLNGVIEGVYYENSVPVPYKGLVLQDGCYYYISDGGKAIQGKKFYVKTTNGLTFPDGQEIKARTYEFDSEGKMILLNGVIEGVYYENSIPVPYKGLVLQDGYYYYISDGGKAIQGKKFYVKTTNGLTFPDGQEIKARTYEFDAEGKMIL